MLGTEPPKSLILYQIGCELWDRGDVEAGQVLLEKAHELASLTPEDEFCAGLLSRIGDRLCVRS
jgi:hypothetical protein